MQKRRKLRTKERGRENGEVMKREKENERRRRRNLRLKDEDGGEIGRCN
jgi:hypothetical protein